MNLSTGQSILFHHLFNTCAAFNAHTGNQLGFQIASANDGRTVNDFDVIYWRRVHHASYSSGSESDSDTSNAHSNTALSPCGGVTRISIACVPVVQSCVRQ